MSSINLPTTGISFGGEISTILRHDAKQNTYKIALVRAINDLALAYSDVTLGAYGQSDVAVPLKMLASRWIAFYWAFVEPNKPIPIWQGQRNRQADGSYKQDMAFRPELTRLRELWERESEVGSAKPSDGFYLVSEMSVPRRRALYSADLQNAFEKVRNSIAKSIEYPIRYAGPGAAYSVFPQPATYPQLLSRSGGGGGGGQGIQPRVPSQPLTQPTGTNNPITVTVGGSGARNLIALPGTTPNERCVVIPNRLWQLFTGLSLWVEALCIHEWAVFTERLNLNQTQPNPYTVTRGLVYTLLTDYPANRRPLTWERNRIDILLYEGKTFVCPWTAKPLALAAGTSQLPQYDLDHIIPITLYPINELWNLIPSDRQFNQHTKRERLPSVATLQKAIPHLMQTYSHYLTHPELETALWRDAGLRFVSFTNTGQPVSGSLPSTLRNGFPARLVQATSNLVLQITQARNASVF